MNTADATPELQLPEISTSTAGSVVVELTPSDAQTLARVLAHYDAIVTYRGPEDQQMPVADGYVPEVWHHTLIALLAEAANARLQVTAPAVLVPFRRPGAHA